MDNFNDLKATWQRAKTDTLPDERAMMQIVSSFKNQKLNKKIYHITLSIAASVYFATMMYMDRFGMLSSLFGESLFIISLLIFAYTNIRSLKRFRTLSDCSNREFIEFLEQTQRNQRYYYRYTQVVCMILYSLALLLYLYGLVHDDVKSTLVAYTITIGGLSIFWLILRPKIYRREAQKVQEMINQTKILAEQFK